MISYHDSLVRCLRTPMWHEHEGSPCCVLHEDALPLQLHEKFSSCTGEHRFMASNMEYTSYHLQGLYFILTTQVLQDEIQLSSRLEGVDEINDEGMLHFLQDVPLRFGMGCVLGVAHNHSLEAPPPHKQADQHQSRCR